METELYVDNLTKIGNRAAFDRGLEASWADYLLTHQNFALLYLDGNGIKQINDSFGHNVGDRVIQMIANGIRDYEQSYRVGGDEFAVIIKGPSGKLPSVVQQIHHHLFLAEQTLRSQLGPTAHLSAAIGWAIATDVVSTTQLKLKADAAMYRHKAKGKYPRQPSLVI